MVSDLGPDASWCGFLVLSFRIRTAASFLLVLVISEIVAIKRPCHKYRMMGVIDCEESFIRNSMARGW